VNRSPDYRVGRINTDVEHTREATAESGSVVVVRDVSKAYGPVGTRVLALEGMTLDVKRSEFVCLVGASGCGKSTLLKLVAGLDRPTKGSITVDARRTTMLFQDAALFPWLTAQKNIELAMRLRGIDRKARRTRADELIELVHLTGFADRRPYELSGGMRQRVAVARALAQDADVLLMDEPFGALDAITRDLLHDEIERIWQETGVTIVFVTHNVREAVRLGDRVLLLSSRPGRIVEEFDTKAPRPRRVESPEVSAIASDIVDRLREEVRRHAAELPEH
jgi:NitT/TauT family transport system ATP-binding protein